MIKRLPSLVRVRNTIVRALALNKHTRPLIIRYFVWRYGSRFVGTYDGIPVIMTDYLETLDKGGQHGRQAR